MELLLAQLAAGGGEGGETVLPVALLPRASNAPAPRPPRRRRRVRAWTAGRGARPAAGGGGGGWR